MPMPPRSDSRSIGAAVLAAALAIGIGLSAAYGDDTPETVITSDLTASDEEGPSQANGGPAQSPMPRLIGFNPEQVTRALGSARLEPRFEGQCDGSRPGRWFCRNRGQARRSGTDRPFASGPTGVRSALRMSQIGNVQGLISMSLQAATAPMLPGFRAVVRSTLVSEMSAPRTVSCGWWPPYACGHGRASEERHRG
jgi:hypothetical protein